MQHLMAAGCWKILIDHLHPVSHPPLFSDPLNTLQGTIHLPEQGLPGSRGGTLLRGSFTF